MLCEEVGVALIIRNFGVVELNSVGVWPEGDLPVVEFFGWLMEFFGWLDGLSVKALIWILEGVSVWSS